jgi:hypothetical protein
MINCPTYWDERHPTLTDYPLNVLSTPSAPSRLRNVTPSFVQDFLNYYRADARYQSRRQQQQVVPWFGRRSPRSITLGGLDSIQQPPELRQLGYTETVFPRWNPPESTMDATDEAEWHRQVTQLQQEQQQAYGSDSEPQPTFMNADEHLASLIQHGAAPRSSRSSRTGR